MKAAIAALISLATIPKKESAIKHAEDERNEQIRNVSLVLIFLDNKLFLSIIDVYSRNPF